MPQKSTQNRAQNCYEYKFIVQSHYVEKFINIITMINHQNDVVRHVNEIIIAVAVARKKAAETQVSLAEILIPHFLY